MNQITTKPCWSSPKEEAEYQAGVEKLYYKDEAALALGFIQHHYDRIKNSVANDEFENPHLIGLPVEEIFIRLLDRPLTDQILYLGYHVALSKDDWNAFLCAQFSANRLEYQHNTRAYIQNWSEFDGPLGTGCDRSSFFQESLTVLGGCDLALAKSYLPHEDGLTKNGYAPFVAATNLLMCLLHQETAWQLPAIKAGKKQAANKGTGKLIQATLYCLVAVIEQDVEAVNLQLQLAIDVFRKAGWIHDYRHPLSKFCPRIIYGLYFAAQYFLAKDCLTQLKQPKHFLWHSAYVAFCESHQFQPGKNLIQWPEELTFLNAEFDDLNRWKSFPCTKQSD
jgi:hypothetical protein